MKRKCVIQIAASAILLSICTVTPQNAAASASYDIAPSNSTLDTASFKGTKDGQFSQTVEIEEGLFVTLLIDEHDDLLEISSNQGDKISLFLSETRRVIHSNDPVNLNVLLKQKIQGVNACQVATGAAGIVHPALWGLALGGPAGAAAAAGYGAFWWALGTQC